MVATPKGAVFGGWTISGSGRVVGVTFKLDNIPLCAPRPPNLFRRSISGKAVLQALLCS